MNVDDLAYELYSKFKNETYNYAFSVIPKNFFIKNKNSDYYKSYYKEAAKIIRKEKLKNINNI
jgi:hypothetical protein